MTRTEPLVLRRSDFSLSRDQESVREVFRSFFSRECPMSRVRATGALGYDAELWSELAALGIHGMGIPETCGGDGGSLVDLALVVEEAGRAIAPLPIVESFVARRLIAEVQATGSDVPGGVGDEVVTFATEPASTGNAQIVANGAIARRIVGLVDHDLVLDSFMVEPSPTRNLGGVPIGWWCPRHEPEVVLARGSDARDRFRRADAEWKVLTGAALVGLSQRVLDLTVEYANERIAFDVPIGTFQAIAHPIVDVATAIEGARRFVWKAAWYLEHEPEGAPALPEMCFWHASQTASLATRTGIHTQGGLGYTLESDLQLYFRRAKGWSLVAGDPGRALLRIADALYGPVASVPG